MMEEWVIDVYRVAGGLAMGLWPVVWFASLSSWKYALGPEVSAVWTRRWRVWLSLAAFAVGVWMIAGQLDAMTPGGMSLNRFLQGMMVVEHAAEHPMDVAIHVVQLWSAGLLPVLGAALGVKLYEKWVNGRLSEAERRPGRVGVRAWLSGWNVVLIVGVAACASLWYGFVSFFAALMMTAAVVLAYPVAVTAMSSGGPSSSAGNAPPADLSPERERVLRLLEEGRVTAEEAAELLSALGATLPPPVVPAGEPWTPGRKLMVLGAVVVLIGFFLPWFEVNLGREMRQTMNQVIGSMPMGSEMQGMAVQGDDAVAAGTPTVRVTGGDIGHGLGWIALGLGIGAALVPMLLPTLARDQRRGIMTVALAGGAILLLYLLTGNLSRVSFGLPLVMIGYALEIVGLLRDQFAWHVPALRTTAQAV